jgi:hypothetical protein
VLPAGGLDEYRIFGAWDFAEGWGRTADISHANYLIQGAELMTEQQKTQEKPQMNADLLYRLTTKDGKNAKFNANS